MISTKKFKSIIVILFSLILLSSCEDKCYERGEYFVRMSSVYSNPDKNKTTVYGSYPSQSADWQQTGLVTNGDPIVVAIRGGWISNSGAISENQDNVDASPNCPICFKKKTELAGNSQSNCICGPSIVDNSYQLTQPAPEEKTDDGTPQNTQNIDCTLQVNYDDADKCTCKKYASDLTDSAKLAELISPDFIYFPLGYWRKEVTLNGSEYTLKPKNTEDQKSCRLSMGYGLYLKFFGTDNNTPANEAYHLYSFERICPIPGIRTAKCETGGVDKSIFIYRGISNNTAGQHIRLTFDDVYYSDNSGAYNVQFIGGVNQVKGSGLLTEIVSSMEGYLFGSTQVERDGTQIRKSGIVEFFYVALFKDPIVKRVINITLVLYVCFYGLTFLMGITDFGRKEIMMRLIKIGLVTLFTSPNAWSMYNTFVVGFFKNGMDSIIGMITRVFDSNMNSGLANLSANEPSSSASGKFIFIDNMIKDLTSKANINRIFGLFGIKGGKGMYAFITVPAIIFLIGYFIYTMLDIAVKYLINLLKICFGLALGPIFILFVLFEKTKDMFKNWLSFMGSRTLEIIILIAIIHPFVIILDGLFKQMLDYKVCAREIGMDFFKVTFPEAQGLDSRSLINWFEFLLKIAAFTFITKTMASKAGYISGQLISIGGVANADPVSEVGHGNSGFNLGGSIVKGGLALAKSTFDSKFIKGVALKSARLVARNLTKAGRAEIGGKSINDRINDGFKFFGIRNRGIRSFMRDSEVDKELKIATSKANAEGLTGKDRDSFIRNEVSNSLSLFIANNPSKASALGLDQTNIMKRLDQKLIKEPMKQAMKQKANELKTQGIFGKEARNALRQEGEKWAKENSSIENPQEKVAEFFKKKSMQNYIRSESEINSEKAMGIVKNLIDLGKDKEAKEFMDKFRDNANKNIIRNDLKKEETLKTGGKTGKLLSIFANSTIFLIPNIINSALNKEIKTVDIGSDAKNVAGKIDNFFTDSRRIVKGIKIPFLTSGGPKSNPKKNIRKFDRKFARLMNEKMQNADLGTKERLKENLDLPDTISNKDAFRDRNFLKIKDNDSTSKMVGKAITKGLGYPIIKPAEFLYKKYNTRIKGTDADNILRKQVGLNEERREKADIDQYRNVEKAKSMNRLAQEEFEKLDKRLEEQIKKSLGSRESSEAILINGKELTIKKEVLVDDGYGGKVTIIEDQKQMVTIPGRKTDTDKEYDERIKYFEDSKAFNKPVDNLKLILNDLDKRYHADLESSFDQKLSAEENNNDRESRLLAHKKTEFENLKTYNGSEDATIAEKLSKLEMLSGVNNHELKLKFQQEINDEIAKKIHNAGNQAKDEIESLKSLKNALFDNSALDNSQQALVKNIYEKIANEQVLKELANKDNVGSANAGNNNSPASASTSATSPSDYMPPNIQQDDSKLSKLIYEIYDSGKKIAEINKTDSFSPEPIPTTLNDAVGSSQPNNDSGSSLSASSGSNQQSNKGYTYQSLSSSGKNSDSDKQNEEYLNEQQRREAKQRMEEEKRIKKEEEERRIREQEEERRRAIHPNYDSAAGVFSPGGRGPGSSGGASGGGGGPDSSGGGGPSSSGGGGGDKGPDSSGGGG